MIIKRNFFKGDLFLPAMSPSITDNDNVNSLQGFIDTYSEKCLIECFGYTLFAELVENLDVDKAKETSDAKWKNLIEGEIVTLSSGQKKRWKGLAYKSVSTNTENDLSLISGYVYYFYERSEYIAKSTTGDVKLKAEGSVIANPGYKTSIAWNNFVDEVVGGGSSNLGKISTSDFGDYIDWFSGNNEFSLYEYIRYKNDLDKSTYKFFAPKYFTKINEFGI